MYLSIITCTKNSEKFIEKNINSVLNQKFRNYEHIIIDGESTDKTHQIVKKYLKITDKIKFFKFPPKGISNAFNKGLEKACGDYIFFLNSDDYFYDDKVLQDVYTFLKNNDIDWVYGKINVIEESGKSVSRFPKIKLFQIASKNLLKYINYIPHQAVFMKKKLFENYGLFDETLTSKMDYDLWLRIAGKTGWRFFDRTISNFTIREGSQGSAMEKLEENRNNLKRVRNRYLNKLELYVAGISDILIRKYNKTLR